MTDIIFSLTGTAAVTAFTIPYVVGWQATVGAINRAIASISRFFEDDPTDW